MGLGAACAKPPLVDRAMAMARTGKHDAAIALLQERLAVAPDDRQARKLVIRLYGLAGNVRAARTEFEELRKRSPADDPSPHLELGHALELAHRFDEALDAYDEAARAAPTSPAGPREGGLRAARWGEAEAASERLEEAVRRGANDAETYHALGLSRLHARDLDGAERAYRAALATNPEAVENLVGLASVALVREDYAAALLAYDSLRSKRPRLAAAELGRAYALARLGRSAEARTAIDRAEQLGGPPKNVAKLRELVGGP